MRPATDDSLRIVAPKRPVLAAPARLRRASSGESAPRFYWTHPICGGGADAPYGYCAPYAPHAAHIAKRRASFGAADGESDGDDDTDVKRARVASLASPRPAVHFIKKDRLRVMQVLRRCLEALDQIAAAGAEVQGEAVRNEPAVYVPMAHEHDEDAEFLSDDSTFDADW